jgi:diaminohydroxyphosphoribosylaminopyrimidine deaminase/5-amino-6-(5-phosphoribosylamino)uracil reductase
MNKTDRKFMSMALKLARKGGSRTFPNPMVGAVIVKDGKVAGKGYHQFYGGPHAEVYALREAGSRARNAKMYVTLEPCSHYGKTPPCADAIIKAGVQTVYIGMKDPNPLVSGRGINKLIYNSIKTHVGLLEKEIKTQNKDYLKHISTDKKRVLVKAAMTLDGKIATYRGDSKWISGRKSRDFVHKLRARVDGILVGINTVLKDNPALTSHGRGKNPVRIIIDPGLKIPYSARVLDGKAPTIVFHGSKIVKAKLELLKKKGVILCPMKEKSGKINFKYIINKLNKMSINSILIEGGGETIGAAFEDGVVNEINLFIAPKIIRGSNAKSPVEGLGIAKIANAIKVKNWKIRRFGPDFMISGVIK